MLTLEHGGLSILSPVSFFSVLKFSLQRVFPLSAYCQESGLLILKLLAWLSLDMVDTSADFFLGTFTTGI